MDNAIQLSKAHPIAVMSPVLLLISVSLFGLVISLAVLQDLPPDFANWLVSHLE